MSRHSSFRQLSLAPSRPGAAQLVRGSSCSLVDIPTYLSPAGPVAGPPDLGDVSSALARTFPLVTGPVVRPGEASASAVKQQQLDLANTSRKSQWAIFCVALVFLAMCTTLVGAMLSFGTRYQDRLMADRLNITARNVSVVKHAEETFQ